MTGAGPLAGRQTLPHTLPYAKSRALPTWLPPSARVLTGHCELRGPSRRGHLGRVGAECDLAVDRRRAAGPVPGGRDSPYPPVREVAMAYHAVRQILR